MISTALALSTLAALVLGGAASPAAAEDSTGLSGAPATEGSADGRTRFSYQIAPGQHLEDQFQVSNTGTTPQTMTVLATDAYNTPDGGYGLLDTDAAAVDSGSWVTFSGAPTATVVLEPGASQVVPFALDVPADAAPGDHAGGIVVSSVSPDGQILVDRRVATRLYVRVPGDIQAGLTVSSMSAEYQHSLNPLAGEATISMTITNTGNVALGALAVVGVKTWMGIQVGELARPTVEELLPGSTRTVEIVVAGVPGLGYLNPFVTLAPTVSPDALQPAQLRTVARDTTLFAMPWYPLAVLLLVGGVLIVSRLRRRTDARRAAAWVAHVEAESRRKALEDAGADGGDAETPARPIGAGAGRP